MKIKKFVLLNVLFSIILLTILFLLSYLNLNYFSGYSSKFLMLDKNKNISKFEMVNLGSSHAYNGIEYPKDIKGYNFGLPSQKLYYDYKILKKYVERLDREAIVIIPISIFSFYDVLKTENIDKNYAAFLKKDEILHIKYNEYFMLKYFSITQPITRIFKILEQIKLFIKNKKIENKIEAKMLNFEEKKKDSVIKARDHLKIEDKSSDLGIKQLGEIISLCFNKGYKPILITTPFSYFYNEEIGKINYEKRIYENVNFLIKKNPEKKIIYLDYSHDKRFINNLEYFSDSDHLNKKGAEHFTEILLKDIEKELKNERKI